MSRFVPDGFITDDWMSEFVIEAVKTINIPENRRTRLIHDLHGIGSDDNEVNLNRRFIRIFFWIRHSRTLTLMLSTLCTTTPGVCLTEEIYFVIDAYESLNQFEHFLALSLMLEMTIACSLECNIFSNRILKLIMSLYYVVKHNHNLTQRLFGFFSIRFIYGSDQRFEFFLEMHRVLEQESYNLLLDSIDDYFRKVNEGKLADADRFPAMQRIAFKCFGNNEYHAHILMQFLTRGDKRFVHPRGFNSPPVLLRPCRAEEGLNAEQRRSCDLATFYSNATELERASTNIKLLERDRERQPSNRANYKEDETFWGKWETFETNDNVDHWNTLRESIVEHGYNTENVEEEKDTRKSRTEGEIDIESREGASNYVDQSCGEHIVECDSLVEKVTEEESVTLSSDKRHSEDETEFWKKRNNAGGNVAACIESNVKSHFNFNTKEEEPSDMDGSKIETDFRTDGKLTGGQGKTCRILVVEDQCDAEHIRKDGSKVVTNSWLGTRDDAYSHCVEIKPSFAAIVQRNTKDIDWGGKKGKEEEIKDQECSSEKVKEKDKRQWNYKGATKIETETRVETNPTETHEKTSTEPTDERRYDNVRMSGKEKSTRQSNDIGVFEFETESMIDKNHTDGGWNTCKESNVKSILDDEKVDGDENTEEQSDVGWFKVKTKSKTPRKVKEEKNTRQSSKTKVETEKKTETNSTETHEKTSTGPTVDRHFDNVKISGKGNNTRQSDYVGVFEFETESQTDNNHTDGEWKTCKASNVKSPLDAEKVDDDENTWDSSDDVGRSKVKTKSKTPIKVNGEKNTRQSSGQKKKSQKKFSKRTNDHDINRGKSNKAEEVMGEENINEIKRGMENRTEAGDQEKGKESCIDETDELLFKDQNFSYLLKNLYGLMVVYLAISLFIRYFYQS